MGSLEDHARFELRKQLALPDDDYDRMIADAVVELIQTFAAQGHSGMSASFCRQYFDRLARFEPIGPLTGEADEWVEVSDGVFQNRRCSRVFRDETGAYDIEGRIFRDPDGSCWTNLDSRVYVDFPYSPTSEYVDRDPS